MDWGDVHRKKGQMYEWSIRNGESALCASWKWYFFKYIIYHVNILKQEKAGVRWGKV
jgi:hypothetical protein